MMNKGEAPAQVEDEIGELETMKSTDSKIWEHLDNPSGAPVLPPSSGISELVSEIFSMLDHDREQVELEMARTQLEMKRLNTEEARLEHKKRLDDMKRALKDQKERVRSMKGKELLGAKTDDSGAKVTKSLKTRKLMTKVQNLR